LGAQQAFHTWAHTASISIFPSNACLLKLQGVVVLCKQATVTQT